MKSLLGGSREPGALAGSGPSFFHPLGDWEVTARGQAPASGHRPNSHRRLLLWEFRLTRASRPRASGRLWAARVGCRGGGGEWPCPGGRRLSTQPLPSLLTQASLEAQSITQRLSLEGGKG